LCLAFLMSSGDAVAFNSFLVSFKAYKVWFLTPFW
jgi:hypothetical protein